MLSKIKEKIASIIEFIRIVFLAKRNDSLYNSDDGIDEAVSFNLKNDVTLSGSIRILLYIILFLALFVIWASLFSIDEVSKGNGKVIPSSKEQVIQSLDGGVLERIYVQEGQIVEAGEVLAQLDITRTESTVEESVVKHRALLAQLIRLNSEINDTELVFPDELTEFPDLTQAETRLYLSRKKQFDDSIVNIEEARKLINSELTINTRLAKQGASSTVDVIRLRRQLVDLNMKETELRAEYYVRSREEASRVSSEVAALSQIIRGRRDLLSKSTIKSPVRGIVKNIEINTIGGVIAPNGAIMYIVPLDDTLLIEAQISPRDIAFIHPGQIAQVKITAYDYSIYGGLEGKVITISPDTIKDEQKPDVVYYRVYIRTHQDYLQSKNDVKHFITPGMVSTVDIKSGSKTVLQYLIKPFNKINEALRER